MNVQASTASFQANATMDTTQNVRILLADDHPLYRAGLVLLLRRRFPAATITEVDSTETLLEQIPREPWDLLLLDLSLPRRGGLEILRDLHSIAPNLPVLAISGLPEREYALRVARLGGRGFVCKSSLPDEVVNSVRRVLAGQRAFSPDMMEQLLDRLQGDSAPIPHERLSEREYSVMVAIAKGLGPTEIGGSLGLSPKTVSTYRRRVLEKLGVQTDADVVRYVIEKGLTT